jgi:hypothetical protein
MTPRQQKAAAISRALRRDFGEDAVVINSLPLQDDQQLRIQVIDSKRNAFIEKMCGWGWLPQYLHIHHRVSTTNYSLVPASIFEVRIEEERPIIPDRKIYGEVEERKKTAAEVEAVRKHLGLR